MKNFFFLLLPVLLLLYSCSVTRYYLVRHAEKICEDCETCALVIPEGQDRAKALRDYLTGKGIDTIFTSQCLRTKLTAKPLADALHKSAGIYQTSQLTSFINKLKGFNGKNILVVGHSDQIPVMIDSLAHRHVNIDQDDFDNMFIVTKKKCLTSSIQLQSLTYGEPSP